MHRGPRFQHDLPDHAEERSSRRDRREKLTEDETVPVELRDKPSLVRFSGGIVLPRQNADGVPVTTVNIAKLRLKIIRVGDRLLSQIESGTVDETTLLCLEGQRPGKQPGRARLAGHDGRPANVKNDSVTTLVPINDILKGKPPGAYVLIAMDAAQDETKDYYDEGTIAAQWVVDSDIALTTFQGTASGLTVFARSYATAHPMGGVKLNLVAQGQQRPRHGDDQWRRPRRFRARAPARHRRRRARGGDGLWFGQAISVSSICAGPVST